MQYAWSTRFNFYLHFIKFRIHSSLFYRSYYNRTTFVQDYFGIYVIIKIFHEINVQSVRGISTEVLIALRNEEGQYNLWNTDTFGLS